MRNLRFSGVKLASAAAQAALLEEECSSLRSQLRLEPKLSTCRQLGLELFDHGPVAEVVMWMDWLIVQHFRPMFSTWEDGPKSPISPVSTFRGIL